MPGDLSSPSPGGHQARSVEDRLAALEAMVSPAGVCTRRLVVVDEAGDDRIVGEVAGGHAELRLAVAGTVAGEQTMVAISTGSDPEFGPTIGVRLWAEGDEVAVFSGWQGGSGPWCAAVPGPAIGTASDEPG